MSSTDTPHPYKKLGTKLKRLREQQRETPAEVSGAVEIDETDLAQFEAGKERPSEDILMLLMNHFSLTDDHADELWSLAGYDPHAHCDHEEMAPDDFKQHAKAAMMIMLDPRVMYSDSVEVVSNKQGIIMNFAQTAGVDTRPLTVARVGMSFDQAKAVMGILHQVLYEHDNPAGQRLSGGKTEADSNA